MTCTHVQHYVAILYKASFDDNRMSQHARNTRARAGAGSTTIYPTVYTSLHNNSLHNFVDDNRVSHTHTHMGHCVY